MSEAAAMLIVAATWCVIGIVVSITMARRGHAIVTWAWVGALLGPLAVALALDAVRHERAVAATVTVRPASRAGVAVLVGIDGSAEALAAARAAVELLGDRVSRLAVAAVIDYDAASKLGPDTRGEAKAHLRMAAHALGREAEQLVLVGAASDALARAAHDGCFDVLVVGSRGRGASRALLGSVATRLAHGVGVPVIIGGGPGGGAERAAARESGALVPK